MAQALSERTIALVKATVPALEAHGLDIVREMYSRMFQNPEIRDLFNQSHHGASDAQPRALTGAILAAGAGGFERAYVTLTQGDFIIGEDAAEQVATRFDAISDRMTEIVPEMGAAQGMIELNKAMRAHEG